MYIITFSNYDSMNNQDLETLKQFAALTLDYLAASQEYEVTQLWEHLDRECKLRHRLMKLYPLIDTIINHPLTS